VQYCCTVLTWDSQSTIVNDELVLDPIFPRSCDMTVEWDVKYQLVKWLSHTTILRRICYWYYTGSKSSCVITKQRVHDFHKWNCLIFEFQTVITALNLRFKFVDTQELLEVVYAADWHRHTRYTYWYKQHILHTIVN